MEKRLKLTSEQKFMLSMTVKEIFMHDRGILAADETPKTLEVRFEKHMIVNTPEKRKEFREILFTTPQLEEFIGGVIVNEETIDQKDKTGKLLVDYLLERGIKIGIKLDKGLIDLNETQKISFGIEDLSNRIKDERFSKCSFAKWRALFSIDENLLNQKTIKENLKVLCKYAMIAQRNGLVPIIEPEISYLGDYSLKTIEKIAKNIYSSLYCYLNKYNVYIEGTILKISFITPGDANINSGSVEKITEANINVLISCLPHAATTVVFLSGGHSSYESVQLLNVINKNNECKSLTLSFSFGRALTDKVLDSWKGVSENIGRAQLELLTVSRKSHSAQKGKL